MQTKHVLAVNGRTAEVLTDPTTSLLDTLRGDLDLKAAKFGCGTGQCGACVVWMDGRPAPSCDIPVAYAEGTEVVTLEGLGDEEHPHPLQSSFLQLQAAQCGYCVPGILMSAAALLRDTPRPTRDEVVAALDRHLCRCGAHERMIAAVLAAAAVATP
jgi:nicotinate dehydrogenase subunit A